MAVSDPAAALRIERLEPRHAEAVAPLSVEAGWNQVAADWRLMIELGVAFGIRAPSGQWIASALVLPLGPAISWIGMVLVTAPARRQGLGTRLLARCLAEIEQSGVAAGLDATELGRPVYLPLGFRDVYPLSRWRLEPGARGVAVDPPAGIRVRPAAANDLPRIIACDTARSGFKRGAILEHLLSRAPSRGPRRRAGGWERLPATCSVATVMPRCTSAPSSPTTRRSRSRCSPAPSARSGSRVILDVPDRHRQVREWLAAQGGVAPRGFMRMLRGSFPPVEDAAHVFASRRAGACLRGRSHARRPLDGHPAGGSCRPAARRRPARAPLGTRREAPVRPPVATRADQVLHRCGRGRARRRRARHAVPDQGRRPLPPRAGAGRRNRRCLDAAPAGDDRRRDRQDRPGRGRSPHGACARLSRRPARPERHGRRRRGRADRALRRRLPARCR